MPCPYNLGGWDTWIILFLLKLSPHTFTLNFLHSELVGTKQPSFQLLCSLDSGDTLTLHVVIKPAPSHPPALAPSHLCASALVLFHSPSLAPSCVYSLTPLCPCTLLPSCSCALAHLCPHALLPLHPITLLPCHSCTQTWSFCAHIPQKPLDLHCSSGWNIPWACGITLFSEVLPWNLALSRPSTWVPLRRSAQT